MSVSLVVRKDLEDVVRSKLLWAILGMFVFLMGVVAVGASAGGLEDAEPVDMLTLFVNLGAYLMVPVAAIFAGYLSIAGERLSGSLRVLFGLGHGRSDVFFGKLASRSAAILVVTAVSLLVTVALMLAVFGGLPATGTFVAFVVLTLLLAVAFTAISVAVSAVGSTRYRAMGGAIGAYLVFVMFWYPVVAGIHYVVEGARPGHQVPEWYLFLQLLNPLEAYRHAIMELTGRTAFGLIGWSSIVEDVGAPGETGSLAPSARIAGDLPIYLSEWFAGVVLVAWIALAAAFGYWQFQRADLN